MHEMGPRALARAIAWRVGFLVLQAGVSFGVFVALAHVLSEPQYAAIAVAQGTLVIAQAIGDFGLSQAAISLLPARIASAPEREGELMRSAAGAYLWCAAAALIIAAASSLLLPQDAAGPVLAIAPAAALSVLVSGADGLLRARGDVRRPVLLVGLSRAGLLIAVPVAAISDSATTTALAVSAGTALGSIPAVSHVWRTLRSGPTQAGSVRAFARSALPLGVSQVLTQGVGRINTLLIGALASIGAAAAFEASWRLYQLGQYAVGAVATATAPAIGNALGEGRSAVAERIIVRLALGLAALGVAIAATLLLLRGQLARSLFDELGGAVAEAIVPLLIVTPLAFVGFFAAIVLASVDDFRRDVAVAALLGSVVNIVCLMVVVDRSARGACLASAYGVTATNLYLMARLVVFRRRLVEGG